MARKRNIFEIATMAAYRFSTVAGPCTVEDLWRMPLLSRGTPNLDDVAKAIATKIRESEEQSFVSISKTSVDDENKLAIVKHIIAHRLAEEERHSKAQANAARKQKLLALKSERQDDDLRKLSEEELDAELAALDD